MNYKINIKISVYLLLIVFTVIQIIFFFLDKNYVEAQVLKSAVISLVIDYKNSYLAPKNPVKNSLYDFANEVSKIIPEKSKVIFINDQKDYTDSKYYSIRFWMKPNIIPFFINKNEELSSKEKIVNLISGRPDSYLVIYERKDIIRLLSPEIKATSAVYKFEKNDLQAVKYFEVKKYYD